MKAVVIHDFGGPEVLSYEDVPRPEPGAGEVLIKVHAAGINPVDWKTRQTGGLVRAWGGALPYILGWDVSGVVESLGAGVDSFAVGDAVYGMARFPQMGAAYAEYVTSPVTDIAHKPATLDHVHAAGVPLAALTAWQALLEYAQLADGQRILIHAAAGGVGHLAVQIAKWRGAYVIGTASASNADYLRANGVDEIIDYRAVRFEDVVHDVDAVLETVGGDNAPRSLSVIKPGGMFVSITGFPPPEVLAQFSDVRAERMLVRPSASQLAEITGLIDDGVVKPNVDTVFALAEAGKAHMQGERGHTRGKLVLRVASE